MASLKKGDRVVYKRQDDPTHRMNGRAGVVTSSYNNDGIVDVRLDKVDYTSTYYAKHWVLEEVEGDDDPDCI